MFFARSSFVLVLASLASACASESAEGDAPQDGTFVALSADIGPEGGELVAPPDSPQAGVSLRIPAGALAQKVRVSIDATLDPTPLPFTADGVGPQVRISPAGTVLAKPALLTVPFDAEARSRFRDRADQCKVWTREGDGWKRLEQVASTETTVTVELSTFATSAAGVLFNPKPTLCGGTSTCKVITISGNASQDEPCSSPTGYCVTRLTDPPKSFMLGDFEHLSVSGNKAYYGHIPGVDRATIVRYDIATGQSSLFTELAEPPRSGSSFQYPRGRVAVEADGSAWLGINGYGNVRFRASSTPSVFDRDATFVHGVAIDEGAILRTRSKFAPRVNGRENGLVMSVFRDANEQVLFRYDGGTDPLLLSTPGVADASGPRLVVRTAFNGFEQFFFGPGTAASVVLRDTESDTSTVYGAVAVSERDNSFAVANAAYQEPWRIDWRFAPGQPSSIVLRPDVPVSSMAMDASGQLFFVNNESPELFIAEVGGAITRVGLTTAGAGTDSNTRLIPRTIRFIREKNQFLLVTRGLAADKPEFYLVKKSSS